MKFYLLIYRFISIIFLPIIAIFLVIRIFKKKERLDRLGERFGFSGYKNRLLNDKNDIIWIHAVSVGEANCAFLLASEIVKFSAVTQILLTTTTLTSAEVIAQKIASTNQQIIHQFLPIDVDFCIKKFLKFWQPKSIIFVESEIWPNTIAIAKSLAIPCFLVNARISEKSLKKWQKLKKIGFNIFDYFSIIFAQSSEEQRKLNLLSQKPVLFFGNLKAQINITEINEDQLNDLKKQIGVRPIWLCSSTHKGEEEIILRVHDKLQREFKNLLTIIVPRHPLRINEIINLCSNRQIAIRSKNQNILDTTEIYIADTLNELGIFYSLADFALIGGSLLPIGGHNPFEAIQRDCSVITGLHLANFAEIYQELFENNGVIFARNEEDLFKIISEFLNGQKNLQELNFNAKKVLKNNNDCAVEIIKRIIAS